VVGGFEETVTDWGVRSATTDRAQGDLTKARELLGEVVKTRTRLLGEHHPDTTSSAWNRLMTLRGLEARAPAEEVLESHLTWLLREDRTGLAGPQRQIAEMLGDWEATIRAGNPPLGEDGGPTRG